MKVLLEDRAPYGRSSSCPEIWKKSLQKCQNGAFSSSLCKLQPREKTRTLMREGDFEA